MENSNVNEDSGMKVDPIGDSSSPAPQPPVDERLQKALDKALYAGGRPAAQKIRNFLNGTWLGEPLHVVLKDVPAAAWTVAMVCDLLYIARDRCDFAMPSHPSTGIGIAGAAGAAAAGITDWSDVDP